MCRSRRGEDAGARARDVKGSMIYAILFVTVVSRIRGMSVTVFPNMPAGNAALAYFKKWSASK